jgi:hypothetical protein
MSKLLLSIFIIILVSSAITLYVHVQSSPQEINHIIDKPEPPKQTLDKDITPSKTITPAIHKFDGGLYEKIERLIAEKSLKSDKTSDLSDDDYYTLLIIANKGVTGSDNVSSTSKDAIVSLLESYGAKNIYRAGTLSFITADVPLSKIAELSTSNAVFLIGDGMTEFSYHN